jgi:hypothetical protein
MEIRSHRRRCDSLLASFLAHALALIQRAFSKSKLLNRPVKLFVPSKENKGLLVLRQRVITCCLHAVITFTG